MNACKQINAKRLQILIFYKYKQVKLMHQHRAVKNNLNYSVIHHSKFSIFFFYIYNTHLYFPVYLPINQYIVYYKFLNCGHESM